MECSLVKEGKSPKMVREPRDNVPVSRNHASASESVRSGCREPAAFEKAGMGNKRKIKRRLVQSEPGNQILIMLEKITLCETGSEKKQFTNLSYRGASWREKREQLHP